METGRSVATALAAPAAPSGPHPPASSGSGIPVHRQELLKWNGWGYQDSRFEYDPSSGHFRFTGDRYPAISGQVLPLFLPWAMRTIAIDLSRRVPCVEARTLYESIPDPVLRLDLLARIGEIAPGMQYSTDVADRVFHSHGHTLQEIYDLRRGVINSGRLPDVVIWPESHDQVEAIVRLVSQRDSGAAIIPFGGGTSVSLGLACPRDESRMVISLDMSKMRRILSVNRHNLTALCEAGIIGQDLERELAAAGLTTGHEPDSFEFSSLGGWVATRASGMKKNIYGNIEDLVLKLRCVTPIGTIERSTAAVPRMSAGPDIQQLMIGSEGTLGVVTEAVIKVRPLPRIRRYGSIVFPHFEAGVAFMREMACRRLRPASVRLMDNEQFLFGQALRPGARSWLAGLGDILKKFYLTNLKGMSPERICVATLLLESTDGGGEEEVSRLEESILSLAATFEGISAGEENGRRGYALTFSIAYIRDLGLEYGVVAESFETSVPWDRVLALVHNVKDRIRREVAAAGLTKPALISARLTQCYDAGACVYFYFGFNYLDGPPAAAADPVGLYEAIESAARDEILASGGSISHHHGVGKIRARWLSASISPAALSTLRAVKRHIDPQNVFAAGNLLTTTTATTSPHKNSPPPPVAATSNAQLHKLESHL